MKCHCTSKNRCVQINRYSCFIMYVTFHQGELTELVRFYCIKRVEYFNLSLTYKLCNILDKFE